MIKDRRIKEIAINKVKEFEMSGDQVCIPLRRVRLGKNSCPMRPRSKQDRALRLGQADLEAVRCCQAVGLITY